MNIKQHIEAGHYACDSSGRALIRMASGDAVAVICATDKPGRYPILGWVLSPARIASIEFAWDENGNAGGENEYERLLPPPPRKVEVKVLAIVIAGTGTVLGIREHNNPPAGIAAGCERLVELTGSYEEPWS